MTEQNGPEELKKDINPGEDDHVPDQAKRHQDAREILDRYRKGEDYSELLEGNDLDAEQISDEEANRQSRIATLKFIIERKAPNYQLTGQETLEDLEEIKRQIDEGLIS